MSVVYLILVLSCWLSESPIAYAQSLSLTHTVLINDIVSGAIVIMTSYSSKHALLLIAFIRTADIVVSVSIMVGGLLRCVIGWRLHRRMPAIAHTFVAVL